MNPTKKVAEWRSSGEPSNVPQGRKGRRCWPRALVVLAATAVGLTFAALHDAAAFRAAAFSLAGADASLLQEVAPAPGSAAGVLALELRGATVSVGGALLLGISVEVCGCTVGVAGAAALPLSFGSGAACVRIGSGVTAVDIDASLDPRAPAVHSLAALWLSSPATSPPQPILTCTAAIRLMPGLLEPTLEFKVSLPSLPPLPAGVLQGAPSVPKDPTPAGRRLEDGPNSSVNGPFSTVMTGSASLAGALDSAALGLSSARILFRGATLVAALPATGVFAAVHLSDVNFTSDADRGVSGTESITFTAGVSLSPLLSAAGQAGGAQTLASAALRGVLPEQLRPLLDSLLSENAISMPTRPVDIVLLGASLPPAALAGTGSALLVTAAEIAWATHEAPAGAASSSAACSPIIAFVRAALFADSTAENFPADRFACTGGLLTTLSLSVSSPVSSNVPSPATTATSSRRRRAQALASSASAVNIAVLTPDISIDVGSMTASAAMVLFVSSTNFFSASLANALLPYVGTFSTATSVEMHVPAAWQHGVPANASAASAGDESVAFVGGGARGTTLWSKSDCGLASVTLQRAASPFPSVVFNLSIAGSASLSGLYNCADYLARSYMVGSHSGTPISARDVAIKDASDPSQPRGSVRIVAPLMGSLSLPMAVASLRWMVGSHSGNSVLTSLPPGDAQGGGRDVLPRAAMVAHGTDVFSRTLMFTMLNASVGSGSRPASLAPARAWALSARTLPDTLALKSFIAAGCAVAPPGTPLCTGFDALWHGDYLGVDGILLAGDCGTDSSGAPIFSGPLCLTISWGSDPFGLAAGAWRGGVPFSSSLDPLAAPNVSNSGAWPIRGTAYDSPGPCKVNDVQCSGLEITSLLTYAREGNAAYSGVRITAAVLLAWLRKYITQSSDTPVLPQLGPVPRVNATACYGAALGGVDISADKRCLFEAAQPWLVIGLKQLAAAQDFSARDGDGPAANALLHIAPTVLSAATSGWVDAAAEPLFSLMSDPALGDTAVSALQFAFLYPPVYLAYALSGEGAYASGLFSAAWAYARNSLHVTDIDVEVALTLANTTLGSAGFLSGIALRSDLSAATYFETFSHNSSGEGGWPALRSVLCAARATKSGGSGLPASMPAFFACGSLGASRVDTCGTFGASTPFVANLGAVIDAADAVVSRGFVAVFPRWANDSIDFSRPVSDFGFTVARTFGPPMLSDCSAELSPPLTMQLPGCAASSSFSQWSPSVPGGPVTATSTAPLDVTTIAALSCAATIVLCALTTLVLVRVHVVHVQCRGCCKAAKSARADEYAAAAATVSNQRAPNAAREGETGVIDVRSGTAVLQNQSEGMPAPVPSSVSASPAAEGLARAAVGAAVISATAAASEVVALAAQLPSAAGSSTPADVAMPAAATTVTAPTLAGSGAASRSAPNIYEWHAAAVSGVAEPRGGSGDATAGTSAPSSAAAPSVGGYP